jgi:hypothetical protein
VTGRRNDVWNGQTFVDVTGWKRPAPKFPAIHRDTMQAAVHPATGQVMDSKSRFRDTTKAHGLVEVGNDYRNNQNPRAIEPGSAKKDIAEAIQMLEQGYTPPPVDNVADWGETRMIGDT